MVLTLVNPIIELAKRNIEHNAKKNDKFLDIYHTMEYLQQQEEHHTAQIKDLKRLISDLQQLNQSFTALKVEAKGRIDAQDLAVQRMQVQMEEVPTIRVECLKLIQMQDLKISQLPEQLSQQHEQVVKMHKEYEQHQLQSLDQFKQQFVSDQQALDIAQRKI